MSNILKIAQVSGKTGKSVSQIKRDVRKGTFPAPIKISLHAIGWIESEVEEWIATRPRVSYAPVGPASKDRSRLSFVQTRSDGKPSRINASDRLDAYSEVE